MDFQQAQKQFKILDEQFRRGKITREQYCAALVELRVSDASGNIWQIQERTGAWYVFWQGQWVASTPPVSAAPVPSPALQAFPSGPRPVAGLSPRKSSSKTILIVGGLALLVVLLAVGMVLLLKPGILSPTANGPAAPGQASGAPNQPSAPSQPAAPTATSVPQTTFSQAAPIPVPAGGGPVGDEHGVTLSVPAGAADTPAQMAAVTASGELMQQLENVYKVETPFYQVAVQGQVDGVGAAGLSFPAPSPNSRLLVLVDQQYPILLDVVPQDGKLAVQAHLGPSDTGGGAAALGSSIYYAVVTPKQASLAPSVAEVSSRLSQTAPEGKVCSPPTWGSLIYFQRCESNQAGTIKVAYPIKSNLTHFDIDSAIFSVETALAKYPYSKLNGSKFTADSPMIMVVSGDVVEPKYNAGNGVIYTPLDVVTELSTNSHDMLHEMGHLIEGKTYSMYVAGNSSSRTWWMEVATENLVMLVNPSYIKGNIDFYGSAVSLSSPDFIFQNAPYQWPCEGVLGSGIGQRGTCADYYIQAQLLKVNLCAGGACPLSEDSFLDALNQGTFPFNDSSTQDKVTANLEDYARYLIGLAPVKANSSIPLDGVQKQDKYGQQLTITKTTKGDFAFAEEAQPPQLTIRTSPSGINGRNIDAKLDKDGVYPLQITSGVNDKHPGIPAALVIEAGVPFYYRLDGGELKESDGSKEVTIAPIHSTLGIKSVRLVAWSKNGDQSFKAHIEPVDLKGTWVVVPGKTISSNVQCTETSADSSSNPEAIGQLGATFIGLVSGMGEMTPDSSGLSLDWSLVPARLPEGTKADELQFQSTALIGPDDIKMQSKLDLPKPTTTSQRQALPMDATGLAAASLLPAVGLMRLVKGKKGRWSKTPRVWSGLALGAAFILMALALAGCFGLAMYGSFSADVKITGLEYKGGKGTATWTYGGSIDGDPVWSITKGTGTYPVSLSVDVTTEDDKGVSTTTTNTCSGTAVFEVTGYIFEDLNIVIPKSSSGN